MTVHIVLDDYRQAGAIWPDDTNHIPADGPRAPWLEHALAQHLGAHVTTGAWGADPRQPRALTLTVHGATRDAVDEAADLYLGSSGVGYRTEAA